MFEKTEQQNAPSPEDRNEIRSDFGIENLRAKMKIPRMMKGANTEAEKPGGGGGYSFSPDDSIEEEPELVDQVATLSDDAALMTGGFFANTFDTFISTLIGIYAKADNVEEYGASDKQRDLLKQNLAALAKKYGWTVDNMPEFTLGLNVAAIYIPRIRTAKQDREIANIREDMTEMKAQLAKIKEDVVLEKNKKKDAGS